jgi:hypothetical protein
MHPAGLSTLSAVPTERVEDRAADADNRFDDADYRTADADNGLDTHDRLDTDRRDTHDWLDVDDWTAPKDYFSLRRGWLQQAVPDRQPRGRHARPKGQTHDPAFCEHGSSPRKKVTIEGCEASEPHWFAFHADFSHFRSACASTMQA